MKQPNDRRDFIKATFLAGIGAVVSSSAVSAASGAIIPFLQGVIRDHYSWQWAFIMPALCYLYILFYAVNGYRSKYNSFA